VHDDASTDNSISFIKTNYPEVILIESQTNVGFCKSNNRLSEIAQGKFLLFLNNDATLLPDALSTLYSSATTSTTPTILGLPQFDMQTGELIDRGSIFDVFLNPIPNKKLQRQNVGMIIGACLWIPKVIWDEIGGFPEWFHTLTEDLYICLVAQVVGYDVKVLTNSGFKHWVGKSLGGGKVKQGKLETTYRRRRLSERNKTFVIFLCYPLLLLVAVFPIHLLILCIEGILLSISKHNKEIWSSIYLYTLISVWKERKLLLQHRKKIQQNRKISYRRFLSIFTWYPYKLKMLLLHGLPSLK
jgi:GT2 family glycosyltransferase